MVDVQRWSIPALVLGIAVLIYGWSGCGRYGRGCGDDARVQLAIGAGAIMLGVIGAIQSRE